MSVRATVTDTALEVSLDGIDAVLALRGHLTVPLDDIVEARLMPRTAARAQLGWRVGGGYWPGRFATGRFTGPAKGDRQFWSVYRDQEVLVVDTAVADYRRIVLQLPDRADIAWYLNERLARRPRV